MARGVYFPIFLLGWNYINLQRRGALRLTSDDRELWVSWLSARLNARSVGSSARRPPFIFKSSHNNYQRN